MHKDPFLPCSRYSQVQLINCVHETTDELLLQNNIIHEKQQFMKVISFHNLTDFPRSKVNKPRSRKLTIFDSYWSQFMIFRSFHTVASLVTIEYVLVEVKLQITIYLASCWKSGVN